MAQDLQEVVDSVSALLAAPAVLEDRDFNLVAFHSQLDEIDAVRAGSILRRGSPAEVRTWFEQFGIARSEGPVRTPADPETGIIGRLCLPARWNGVTYGYLWLLDPDGRAGTPQQLEAAMAMAREAGAVLAQRARGRQDVSLLLDDLLSPDDPVSARAADDLDRRGLAARSAMVAVVHAQLAPGDRLGVVPVNVWTLPRHVLSTSGEGFTTLLVLLPSSGDLSRAGDAAERLRSLYPEQVGEAAASRLVIGVGSARPGVALARESAQQARTAAQAAASVRGLGPVARWSDLGVYRLLACGPHEALVEAVLDPRAQRLLEHGDRELVRTAAVFLDHAGNVQRTADELAIHRQTTYYRLGRIAQLTGLDLGRGEDRLVLHLALRMAPALTSPD